MAANDALKTLHTALVDAGEGYKEAARDAKDPAVGALFEEMIALHARQHAELHRLLEARGERPDDSGSFMSSVHRTVIGVRAAVTGLNEHSLESFASGEERLVKDYDRAIAASIGAPSTIDVLARQKEETLAKILTMKERAKAS